MDFSLRFYSSGHTLMLENCEEEKSAHRILPAKEVKKELQIVLLGLIMDLSTIQKPLASVPSM